MQKHVPICSLLPFVGYVSCSRAFPYATLGGCCFLPEKSVYSNDNAAYNGDRWDKASGSTAINEPDVCCHHRFYPSQFYSLFDEKTRCKENKAICQSVGECLPFFSFLFLFFNPVNHVKYVKTRSLSPEPQKSTLSNFAPQLFINLYSM